MKQYQIGTVFPEAAFPGSKIPLGHVESRVTSLAFVSVSILLSYESNKSVWHEECSEILNLSLSVETSEEVSRCFV